MNQNGNREAQEDEDDGDDEAEVFDYLLTYDNGSQRMAHSTETIDALSQRWKSDLGARAPRIMRIPPKENEQLTRFMPRMVKMLEPGKPWKSETGVPLDDKGEPVIDSEGNVIEVERLLPVRLVRADKLLDIELMAGDEAEDEDDEDEGDEDEAAPAPAGDGGLKVLPKKPLPAAFLTP